MSCAQVSNNVPVIQAYLPAAEVQPDCCLMSIVKKIFNFIADCFKRIFSCCYSADKPNPLAGKILSIPNDGNTPLHLATTPDQVVQLMQQGADPFARNNQGWTPAQTVGFRILQLALVGADADEKKTKDLAYTAIGLIYAELSKTVAGQPRKKIESYCQKAFLTPWRTFLHSLSATDRKAVIELVISNSKTGSLPNEFQQIKLCKDENGIPFTLYDLSHTLLQAIESDTLPTR